MKWHLEGLLAKRKWTAYRLAQEAGLTPSAVYKLMKNDDVRIVETATLDAICRALSCKPWDVLEYRGP